MVRKVAPCVVAPTVSPRKMVTMLHQLVLRGLVQAFHNAGHAHEVAQHQHADQRSRIRQQEAKR